MRFFYWVHLLSAVRVDISMCSSMIQVNPPFQAYSKFMPHTELIVTSTPKFTPNLYVIQSYVRAFHHYLVQFVPQFCVKTNSNRIFHLDCFIYEIKQ